MKKQLGIVASFFFLCMSTLLWEGCCGPRSWSAIRTIDTPSDIPDELGDPVDPPDFAKGGANSMPYQQIDSTKQTGYSKGATYPSPKPYQALTAFNFRAPLAQKSDLADDPPEDNQNNNQNDDQTDQSDKFAPQGQVDQNRETPEPLAPPSQPTRTAPLSSPDQSDNQVPPGQVDQDQEAPGPGAQPVQPAEPPSRPSLMRAPDQSDVEQQVPVPVPVPRAQPIQPPVPSRPALMRAPDQPVNPVPPGQLIRGRGVPGSRTQAIPPPAPPFPRPTPMRPAAAFNKPPSSCRYPCCNELDCKNGVVVTVQNPDMCNLGEQYTLDFDVSAYDDVHDVEVTAYLPEGVSYARSQPEAKVEGRKLTWNFGAMRKDERKSAKVLVNCECEGDQCTCFCASAVPVRCCSLLCARPCLTCEKWGPEEVSPGDCINYTITIRNQGTCAAEDVVVTDTVPEGLEHSSCLNTLTYKLGCLGPGETKKINLAFTAVKRGRVCNTAVVTASNAESTSCQWCTNVFLECLEISKTGTQEQQIGKNAEYQITVSNTGDKLMTDVVVTDTAPFSTSIVSAEGAFVNGRQAVWRIKEIRPGENVTYNLVLTTCTTGCFTNVVEVTNTQGCTGHAEFTTRWRGRPALNVSICDTENPICVGEPTSYCISVVNQGPEPDNNVQVAVRFPREITPVAACGDSNATISGQVVKFAPVNDFGARQTLRYRVDARGRMPGDARVMVEVTSDSVVTPIMQQESTIVN